MTEWKKITGEPEQIEEMWNAEHGYILRFKHKISDEIRFAQSNYETPEAFKAHCIESHNVTEYLICNPNPRREMAKRQFDTGQPVYIKKPVVYERTDTKQRSGVTYLYQVTNTPNWYLPQGTIYSFTPFED